MSNTTSEINIEYKHLENISMASKRDEPKLQNSRDIRKEITKFNSKQETKKKMKKDLIKKEELNSSKEYVETVFLDMPAMNNEYNKNATYVKNKIIVMNTHRRGFPNFKPLSMRSTNRSGILYKNPIKSDFSNSNHFTKVKKLNKDQINNKNESNREEVLSLEKTTQIDWSNDKDESKQTENINDSDNFLSSPVKIFNKGKQKRLYNPYKTATTIYTILSKKKNEFLGNLRYNPNKTDNSEDLIYQKKKFLKVNALTHFMEKKGKEEIPYVFPIAWIHQNEYCNSSEKKRYEKITEMFLKLRFYIEKDEENEKKYLKEFMMKNGIYEEKYYTIDRLNNFMNFLNSPLKIDAKKSLHQVIIDATNFQVDDKTSNSNKFMKTSDTALLTIRNKSFQNKNIKLFKNKIQRERSDKEDDKYNMNSYLSRPQPILNRKRFKFDLSNPKSIVDDLEIEFFKLHISVGGLNFNLNDSTVSNKNNLSISRREFKIISVDNKQDKNKPKKNSIKLEQNLETSSLLYKTNSKNISRINLDEGKLNGNKRNLNLPKIKKILNIEDIRKKNKLLEYIVLQRSKNKLHLQQEMKKFKMFDV